MEVFKEAIDYFVQFRENQVDWRALILTIILSISILTSEAFWKIKIKGVTNWSFTVFICRNLISAAFIFLIIWIFGGSVFPLALFAGILMAYFIQEKYFKFLREETLVGDAQHLAEVNRLKRLFRSNPHYSILEVLLYYGYISPSQKESLEINNIFETPEEMASKLLEMKALTPIQLKEAKAIMNLIRREGKILTRQDALLLVAQLEEGGRNDENAN